MNTSQNDPLALLDEHLLSNADIEAALSRISIEIVNLFLNTNALLSANQLWIDLVHEDLAHDPSLVILTNSLKFENGGVTEKPRSETELAAIYRLKEMGMWNHHKTQCDQRFKDSQNWARIMSLVTLYEYWESRYRNQLVSFIDSENTDVKNLKAKPNLLQDVFGDLRILRNEFLHCQGKFTKGDPSVVLKKLSFCFGINGNIVVSKDELGATRDAVLDAINEFPSGYSLSAKKMSNAPNKAVQTDAD